ncbi:hypothetical protein CWI39_0186p0010 [Hamiltosporidium magnivora]|uniref:Uncharacterized protein n=1 Tax=Hamiltosporidium magnivora TaxID=148818 RepID=A0A4Q9LJS5_9MICR|nr:hypothetical protein CWI39_0216p0020 [Hamiltosporidium magnivora]TBU08414.1 hypothetical protein CWI39_0186p0010 [Hamiltosporidium magnivora]
MSSCNGDTEEGQSDRFNEKENNDSLEFVFNNFLSYLFETYFVDIQNVIQCKRNKIIGLVDQKILSSEIEEILSRNANHKLTIFKKILSLNHKMDYVQSFSIKLNTENLFNDAKDIPIAFSKREMHFYEMILKVSRMAAKKMRFSLANLLKGILENGISTMQEDLYKIRRICQSCCLK